MSSRRNISKNLNSRVIHTSRDISRPTSQPRKKRQSTNRLRYHVRVRRNSFRKWPSRSEKRSIWLRRTRHSPATTQSRSRTRTRASGRSPPRRQANQGARPASTPNLTQRFPIHTSTSTLTPVDRPAHTGGRTAHPLNHRPPRSNQTPLVQPTYRRTGRHPTPSRKRGREEERGALLNRGCTAGCAWCGRLRRL